MSRTVEAWHVFGIHGAALQPPVHGTPVVVVRWVLALPTHVSCTCTLVTCYLLLVPSFPPCGGGVVGPCFPPCGGGCGPIHAIHGMVALAYSYLIVLVLDVCRYIYNIICTYLFISLYVCNLFI